MRFYAGVFGGTLEAMQRCSDMPPNPNDPNSDRETKARAGRTSGMSPRGWVIAVICVFELAIIGEAMVAIGAGHDFPWTGLAYGASSPVADRLVEGGPHRIFAVGAPPTLTVDVGYADLTIVTGDSDRIDVSLSPTASPGMFNATGAIVARRSGDGVRIAAVDQDRWSTGDDRMVTVVVPPQTAVTVLGAGDVRADGLRAAASIKSVGDGTIDVHDYQAPNLRVTSNGTITMERVTTARLDATSSDGRVAGIGLSVRDGSVESGDRVMLGFTAGTDTVVSAVAEDGKISTSGFGDGAPVASGNTGDDDSSSLTVRVGSGAGNLDVRSNNGNIALTSQG